jgi:uncharacterized protein YjbI with pentapeptide repeats
LSLADLRGANLSRADLSRVDLTDANLLPYDENNPATWNKHNLEKRSTLSNGASFSRRGLKVTNLSGATLHNAKLGGAWLGGANLRDADLSNADLTSAKGWTEEQLSAAKSLAGATMPNGQKYEDWLKRKE